MRQLRAVVRARGARRVQILRQPARADVTTTTLGQALRLIDKALAAPTRKACSHILLDELRHVLHEAGMEAARDADAIDRLESQAGNLARFALS